MAPVQPSPCRCASIRKVSVSAARIWYCHGVAEFVFQEPAGRRLEDRVLDVVRICKVACATQGVDGEHVELAKDGEVPDEFLIVEHLKNSRLC